MDTSRQYSVTARPPLPQNLAEKVTVALAQAIKCRQAQSLASKQRAAQVQQHRDGMASNPPAMRSQDAP